MVPNKYAGEIEPRVMTLEPKRDGDLGATIRSAQCAVRAQSNAKIKTTSSSCLRITEFASLIEFDFRYGYLLYGNQVATPSPGPHKESITPLQCVT